MFFGLFLKDLQATNSKWNFKTADVHKRFDLTESSKITLVNNICIIMDLRSAKNVPRRKGKPKLTQ